MTAYTLIETNFEELMCRESNGIHVSLLWSRTTNDVLVAVFDAATGTAFELEAGSANPLDVYNHPYAYAAFRHVGEVTLEPSVCEPPRSAPVEV